MGGHRVVEGAVDAAQHPAVGQLGQPPVDGIVQPQLCLLDEDHGGGGRDGLGHRSDAENGVAPHRRGGREVLPADRLHVNFVVPAQQRDHAGHLAAIDIAPHDVRHAAEPLPGKRA